ncbi:cation:proton antiporter [bacterium]|nr:cation:proton antiporter [bacterium]
MQEQSINMTIVFLSLGALLSTALLFGEIARRFNQPPIIGEILAGVVLGKTVIGQMYPSFFNWLFPATGSIPIILYGLTTVGIVLFLLVAGLEVNLSSLWRQGRIALFVSLTGILIPFTIGVLSVLMAPQYFSQFTQSKPTVFMLFFATAISISALPVIARILMDLNILRSDLGMIIITAAIFNDLAGWIIFALILGMITTVHGWPVFYTIGFVLGYTLFMLTIGRWLIHRCLIWIQAHTNWPGGILSVAITLAFVGAAFTEWIGIHAIFGSFLMGVIIGDSTHMREHTRSIIREFVSFIFAPLFFASIGLQLNFILHFDPLLTFIVIGIACLGKIGGGSLGAWLGGLSLRESMAIGSAMNARGAMEIILGLLALNYQIIDERMFVSLVTMALVTSVISGPLIQRFLRHKKSKHFLKFISAQGFISSLQCIERDDALKELSVAAQRVTGISAQQIFNAVLEREKIVPTGLGKGLAVPHARLKTLKTPAIIVGFSKVGIDFNTPDGKPVKAIFMILTPSHDHTAQVHILAGIAQLFQKGGILEQLQKLSNYTEFVALINTNP